MDQVKIGKFIAECRKEKNLTQMQLAEKLNITDRAISKWECGKAMPDTSIMLELCDILGINVNELLCGEKISMVALFGGIFIVAFLVPEGVWQVVAILGICVVFLIPCFYALKLEVAVGAYKCKKCGQEIVPTYGEALRAMHMGFTRHLMCPHCGKRTWCKKVVK